MNRYETYTARWKRVRSFFECPVLDERKWQKVQTIAADAFMVDLEDSVPDHLKERAREKVIAAIHDRDHFGHAMVIPRVNHLSTPWGRDDIIALAETGIDQLMYPKGEHPDDIHEVLELCREYGSDPVLKVTVESALGFTNVERLAAMDEIVVLSCGIGDLHVETEQPLYDANGAIHRFHHYPKLRLIMACAAFGKAKIGFPQQPDIRDLDEYRRRAIIEREIGFNGCAVFYPPHVPILNEVFGSDDDLSVDIRPSATRSS